MKGTRELQNSQQTNNKMAVLNPYLFNNHSKCKKIKFSNEKVENGQIDKTQTNYMLSETDSLKF